MTVIIDGQAYRDGIEKTTEEVYEMLRESGEGAKTSQPTTGEFIQVYEALDNDDRYDAIIAIHASSELTGTYQSSIIASEAGSKPVHVIDSRIGSYPMAKMIQSAVDGRNSDEALADIVQKVK